MDKACDLEAEKNLCQQVAVAAFLANLPNLPGTLDQERTLGSTCESAPSVETLLNHHHEETTPRYLGTAEKHKGSCSRLVCDPEAAKSSEKSLSQQIADPVLRANLPVPGNLDQERKLGSLGDSAPSVQTFVNHLHDGTTPSSPVMVEGSCAGVGSPAALDTDGPNWRKVLSGENLARKALLNEHFNNPLPQRSQHTVSRTEVTDGRTSRTLGTTGQEYESGSGSVPADSGSAVDECPICTESYHSGGDRGMVLLNCDHSMCQCCLATMLRRAADCSRVQCPLCRQKTSLVQWEIYRLQEDTAFCTIPPNPSTPMLAEPEAEPPVSGLCSALEQRLLLRTETARVCGCFGHPRWPIRLIRRMHQRDHCHCCYITLLVIMYLAELTFLCLIFLPVIVLVLLFTLKS